MKCAHSISSWKRRKKIKRMGEILAEVKGSGAGECKANGAPYLCQATGDLKVINIRGSGCTILAFRLKQGLQSDPRAIL